MRILAELTRLKCLDLGLVINDPRADLEELRPFSEPAPLLKRAGRDVPACRELGLREFCHWVAFRLNMARCGAVHF